MLHRLLTESRIAYKLLWISLSFALPIAVLLYFAVSGTNHHIEFASIELHGVDYQRPLEDLLHALPQHQYLTRRALSGETGLDSRQAALQSRIDQALQRLAAVDRQYGTQLQFTQEGLDKRQRSSANARDLAGAWEKLKPGMKSVTPDASDAGHRQLRDTVRTMIAHAGDTSNLILDPDLDSYYLVDVTLMALPQMQDRLGDVLADGRRILSQAELTAADQLRVGVLAQFLREADHARVVGSARTALNEDPNFHGISPTMRNIEQALDSYSVAAEELLTQLTNIAGATTPAVSTDDFEKTVQRATDSSFQLWKVSSQELDALLQIRIRAYQTQRLWSLLLTVLALAISGGLVFLVSRGITQPLANCVVGLQKLAAKDLTYRLNSRSTGEMGEIATAIDQAADGMRQAVSSLCTSATELQQAAEHQTEASQQMSANAEETSTQAKIVSKAADQVSRNTQAVSTAVNELSASIREIASNAHDAARVATEAVQLAGNTNATVSRLGQSSTEIGEVIKVITSIAEQTNLLALNATIEAARAGEAGKGFAVVANAVKELAKETAKATDDISHKIDSTRHDMQEAVDGIRRISHIIEQIHDYQNSIAGAVEEQTVVTRQISSNVSDAARGTTEIAENIIAVAQAAAGTAEGAASTQQAARNSAGLAVRLQTLVAQFQS